VRVVVDRDKCADHGQCVFAAPEVFALDDAGKLVYDGGELGEELRDRVEEAADICPMQAITVDG
jgi:ferredoxin